MPSSKSQRSAMARVHREPLRYSAGTSGKAGSRSQRRCSSSSAGSVMIRAVTRLMEKPAAVAAHKRACPAP